MSAIRLHVTATGMVSSVGLSAASACAAMRAGLSAFGKLPYWDNVRKPVTGSPVPVLPLDMGRHERLVDLLAMAIADALEGEAGTRLEQVPLLVAVAEQGRPGGGADMAGVLLPRVERRLERRFHPQAVYPPGRHCRGGGVLEPCPALLRRGNVMLMTEDQWAKYQNVHGKLFGGQFEYKRALSKQNVLQMADSDVLPAGRYRVVVELAEEALIFKKSTAAAITIIGY